MRLLERLFWVTDGTIGPMRRVTERILKLVSAFIEASKKFTADFSVLDWKPLVWDVFSLLLAY
jgi:hypothetical protein